MTQAEKDVLFQFADHINELHASLIALTARIDTPAVSFESAKNIAKQKIQPHFDEIRKNIEDLA